MIQWNACESARKRAAIFSTLARLTQRPPILLARPTKAVMLRRTQKKCPLFVLSGLILEKNMSFSPGLTKLSVINGCPQSPGGILPYISHIGMCRPKGTDGFCAIKNSQGYPGSRSGFHCIKYARMLFAKYTPFKSHFPVFSIPIMMPIRQANLCSLQVLLNSRR